MFQFEPATGNKVDQDTSSLSFSTRVRDSFWTKKSLATNVATGALSGLIGLVTFGIVTLFSGNDVSATASSITVSVTAGSGASVNIPPTAEGKFAATGNTTFSVATTHAAGYTVSASATALSYTEDNTEYTITPLAANTAISAANFAKDSEYINQWGYLPSKYNSSDNTDFLSPQPLNTPQILDITNDTTGTYDIAVGAKIDQTVQQGRYTTVITVSAVGNPTPYTITYNANAGSDTVDDMPSNVDATDNGDSITLSNNIPTRRGYTFSSWCDTTTTITNGIESCNGDIYTAGSNFELNQTASTNELNLYAMWKDSNICNPNGLTIYDIVCMQDINLTNKSTILSSMAEDAQYQLVDNRDQKVYWVAKLKDGNIWMTQNLDFCAGCTGVSIMTSENTDLNVSGSGAYSTDYTQDSVTGIITWAPTTANLTGSPAIITKFDVNDPQGTTPTVSGWTNSNEAPHMAEGGDHYVYTSGKTTRDSIYSSLDDCTATGKTKPNCTHAHVGDYYNWSAAVASSASSSISSNYAAADNSICPSGWRLPKGQSSSSSTSTTREFGQLFLSEDITTSLTGSNYATGGFEKMRSSPLYFVRGGYIWGINFSFGGLFRGLYWAGTASGSTTAHDMYFGSDSINSANRTDSRDCGFTIRCLVR